MEKCRLCGRVWSLWYIVGCVEEIGLCGVVCAVWYSVGCVV